MNKNKRMTSIARRIHMKIWLKRLGDVIGIDILLFILILGTIIYWRYSLLPADANITSYYFSGKLNEDVSKDTRVEQKNRKKIYFIMKDANGEIYGYNLSEAADVLQYPVMILLIFQGLHLLFSLSGTRGIRRDLKPLNDLAVQADAISKVPLDMSKMESLEKAISHVSPEAAFQGIHTGDKDLESIEIALNNLLSAMKENEKRQSRFVSDASHELRTPIAVIQGYVNMLDRWGKEDEGILDESIEALKNESQHMKELVEQLLFLARGDSGRNALNMVSVDLSVIVNEVYEESVMIDEKHDYSFQGAEGAVVKGDVAMLKQSIRIFVQNAVKYSEEGAAIKMSVKKLGQEVCYIVQDEGIGMESADVVHIFERFYRSDEARNSSTGGSGLGLSIAKWIVDVHGGVIEVVSRPEIGTRFTVKLPTHSKSVPA